MLTLSIRSAQRSVHATMAVFIAIIAGLCSPPALAGDRPDIYTFTPAQRATLFTHMSAYITKTAIEGHLCPPNDKHGSSRFTVWHRMYIKGMEDYLISQNQAIFVPLPKWLPSTCIPAEFLVGGGVDPDCGLVAACGANPGSCIALSNACPGIGVPASLAANLCSQTPYTSFRSTLENTYHNGVHGAVGGVMGSYESPAAPIFWLWHAQVDDIWFDWQCVCGLDEAGAFNSYTAAERITDIEAGVADAWIRDSDADVANEPNNETGAVLWESTDIWVRNSQATAVGSSRYLNEHQHQNPEYAAVPANRPYIYVKVRNRGCTTVSGQLHVYWANASVGLTWPTDFTEVSTSPVAITNITAGREHVGEFHWLDIPVPGGPGGSHFCLIARFEATPLAADPIVGESLNVICSQNVKNSNQIAWKNLTIVDNVANLVPMIVRNVSRNGNFIDLNFTVPAAEANDSFFQHGTLAIDLGELFPRWLQNGGRGEGIKVDPRGRIHILRADATIERLPVAFNEQFLVNLQFGRGGPIPCADDRTVYNVRVAARERDTLLGGNTYEVRPEAVRPSPSVVITAITPLINCRSSSVVLRADATPPPGGAITSYRWFRDGIPLPNEQQMFLTATSSGSYTVLVTYSNGCDSLSDPAPVHIGTRPPNDDPCRAIHVDMGDHAEFELFCATAQPGEVTPGAGSGPQGGCYSHDGWCRDDPEVQNSVWYTFTAPRSGVVTLHAGHQSHDVDHGLVVNTQMAVWDVDDCLSYDTYHLIGANDDSGNHGIFGADPALHDLGGLVPGATYYIQIDGYQGDTGIGTLVIEAKPATCACDWNADGSLNSQDFFSFVVSFFAGQADFNADGETSSQDFFDFLVCFFTLCP
ncbi:MAG: tyrosinase family protein [Pyrinomonadaceae bacterium]|nr:tyrosinase family protein [Phycisphaerales bacterium]